MAIYRHMHDHAEVIPTVYIHNGIESNNKLWQSLSHKQIGLENTQCPHNHHTVN
jgi:hypothetical protein